MNYLYSQECLWSGVEGCSAGLFIPGTPSFLTYNRNVVRLWRYSGSLVLVKEHMLFERVLQAERYRISAEQDGLVLLFQKAKVALARFDPQTNEFKTTSLKFFERDEFDIREEDIRNLRTSGEIGMLQMSKRHFSVFPLLPGTFGARVFRFVEIDGRVRNPIDFVFLENYSMPTVCLVYDSQPRKYTSVRSYSAIVFSIDLGTGGFHVVDEFAVPPRTFRVVYTGAALLFVSHNSVLIRSTSSSYAVALNRMCELHGGDKADGEVVLSDARCFPRGNVCLIFNGNGDRHRLRISMDIKRIIGASLEFEGRGPVVSCVGSVGDLLFLGSVGDASQVFEVRGVWSGAEAGRTDGPPSDEYSKLFGGGDGGQRQDEEYAKLFSTSEGQRGAEDFVLHQVDELPNIGLLNGVTVRSNGEALFAAEGQTPCICAVSSTMPFEMVKSQRVKRYLHCWKAFEFYALGREAEIKVFRWGEGLVEAQGEYVGDMSTLLFAELGAVIVQVVAEWCLVMDPGLRAVGRTEFAARAIEARVVHGGRLLAVRDAERTVKFYDERMDVVIGIPGVTCFADSGRGVFLLSGHELRILDVDRRAIRMSTFSVRGLPYVIRLSPEARSSTGPAEDSEDGKVVEMEVVLTRSKVVMILRAEGCGMAMYESLDPEGLVEADPSAEIVFFKTRLQRYVSFNRIPGDKAFHRAGSMVFVKATTNMFIVPGDKGHLLYRSRYSLNSVAMDGDRMVQLSKGHLMVCRLPGPEDGQYVFDRGFVARKIPVLRTPKHIECTDGYVAVASCEETEFLPGRERDCGVPVSTYRFYVDLYSAKYEHISTYELDENEYVFDIKYLVLDDTQGNHGKSPFLVVCTSFVEGEDRPSRGRLHVLEIISIVPDLESPFKDCKLKLLGVEKTKGSIVQCEEVRGKIALCLGTKIMVYKVDRRRGIIPIGFHDLHMFTSSISVVKNYLLASDIYRGLSFFFFQSKPIRLHLISSSEPLRNVTSTELLAAGTELSMLCCDSTGTVHAYTYSPNNIISMDGAKLVKRAEMKTGLGRLGSSRTGLRKGSVMLYSRTNMLVHVSGVDDSKYLRLMGIQASIMAHLPTLFGLNQRDYLDSDIHLHGLSLKGPVVLHVLNMFGYFDLETQDAISSSAAMDRGEVSGVIASLNLF